MSLTIDSNRTQKVLSYFDSIADSWYGHTLSMKEREFNNRTVNPVIDSIEKIGKFKGGGTLYFLDAGSGSGYWTYEIIYRALSDGYLFSDGYPKLFKDVEVWLVDISPKMLESARHALKYNEKYNKLVGLMDEGRLRFEFKNIDIRELDKIEHPHFDFTFFHKVLSMLEYGRYVQETFSVFSKSTDFLLTAVKSKTHYNHILGEYWDRKLRRDDGLIAYNETDNYLEVKVPVGGGTLITRRMKEDSRLMVNDEAGPRGKNFFEYTYSSSDLSSIYEKNGFKIVPSYNEAGTKLKFVGKPKLSLKMDLPIHTQQDWAPIIQAVGVHESSPYASLFSG